MPEINDFFNDFVSRSFGYRLPKRSLTPDDWPKRAGPEVEAQAAHYFKNDLPDLLLWETAAARNRAEDKWVWRKALANITAGEARNLTAQDINARYSIRDVLYGEDDFAEDIFHIKINHGFWEQYFVVCGDGYQHDLMRPVLKRPYQEGYLDSRFADALTLAISDVAEVENGDMRFGPIDFGFSFNPGGMRHEVLVRNMGTTPVSDLMVQGVYAGSQAWFRQWKDVQRLHFVDGGFAKSRLLDGKLAEILSLSAAKSDEIIFAVPPHLDRVMLRGVDPARQTRLLLSGALVHQAWPLMLAGVGRTIVQRLAQGGTYTVLVQAGVFSALLGLFVYQAKKRLNLPGTVYFFDLGQGLDVASTETAGQWVKNISRRGGLNIESNPFTVMDPA